MLLGVHCSIRNGLVNALIKGNSLNCETIQIFTRSPRIWKAKNFDDREIKEFCQLRKKLKVSPLLVHAPYLPNLASSNKEIYIKSKEALLWDIAMSEKLKADYFIIHPGSYSLNTTRDDGLKNIISAIDYVYENLKTDVMILIENVAGGARKIASNFEDIKAIIEGCRMSKKVGFCLDTAHLFASGYDISNVRVFKKTLSEIDKTIGIDKLKAFHLNNTYVWCGSKIDRHAHIAPALIKDGSIPKEVWAYLVNLKEFQNHPGILETPNENNADLINLRYLRSLKKK